MFSKNDVFRFVSEMSDVNINNFKNEIPVIIGNLIRELRKQKGITQTELGKLTGKDRQYIFKIEKGKVTSSIVAIAIIAKSLAISLKEFFDI
jgi:DNA-binding XRE family transcriptional regulator